MYIHTYLPSPLYVLVLCAVSGKAANLQRSSSCADEYTHTNTLYLWAPYRSIPRFSYPATIAPALFWTWETPEPAYFETVSNGSVCPKSADILVVQRPATCLAHGMLNLFGRYHQLKPCTPSTSRPKPPRNGCLRRWQMQWSQEFVRLFRQAP